MLRIFTDGWFLRQCIRDYLSIKANTTSETSNRQRELLFIRSLEQSGSRHAIKQLLLALVEGSKQPDAIFSALDAVDQNWDYLPVAYAIVPKAIEANSHDRLLDDTLAQLAARVRDERFKPLILALLDKWVKRLRSSSTLDDGSQHLLDNCAYALRHWATNSDVDSALIQAMDYSEGAANVFATSGASRIPEMLSSTIRRLIPKSEASVNCVAGNPLRYLLPLIRRASHLQTKDIELLTESFVAAVRAALVDSGAFANLIANSEEWKATLDWLRTISPDNTSVKTATIVGIPFYPRCKELVTREAQWTVSPGAQKAVPVICSFLDAVYRRGHSAGSNFVRDFVVLLADIGQNQVIGRIVEFHQRLDIDEYEIGGDYLAVALNKIPNWRSCPEAVRLREWAIGVKPDNPVSPELDPTEPMPIVRHSKRDELLCTAIRIFSLFNDYDCVMRLFAIARTVAVYPQAGALTISAIAKSGSTDSIPLLVSLWQDRNQHSEFLQHAVLGILSNWFMEAYSLVHDKVTFVSAIACTLAEHGGTSTPFISVISSLNRTREVSVIGLLCEICAKKDVARASSLRILAECDAWVDTVLIELLSDKSRRFGAAATLLSHRDVSPVQPYLKSDKELLLAIAEEGHAVAAEYLAEQLSIDDLKNRTYYLNYEDKDPYFRKRTIDEYEDAVMGLLQRSGKYVSREALTKLERLQLIRWVLYDQDAERNNYSELGTTTFERIKSISARLLSDVVTRPRDGVS